MTRLKIAAGAALFAIAVAATLILIFAHIAQDRDTPGRDVSSLGSVTITSSPFDEGPEGIVELSPIPCPELPVVDRSIVAVGEIAVVGDASIAVPRGYELRPWLPDPPTWVGGGNFERPGLTISFYPSVTEYKLFDIFDAARRATANGTPVPARYAEDFDQVVSDAFLQIMTSPLGCSGNRAIERLMQHRDSLAVSRTLNSFGDSSSYIQRAVIETEAGELFVVTLTGDERHPLNEQQGVFNAVLDSITLLN